MSRTSGLYVVLVDKYINVKSRITPVLQLDPSINIVKIGRSNNVRKRFATHCNTYGDQCKLLASYDCNPTFQSQAEAVLKDQCKSLMISCEFNTKKQTELIAVTPKQLKFVIKLCAKIVMGKYNSCIRYDYQDYDPANPIKSIEAIDDKYEYISYFGIKLIRQVSSGYINASNLANNTLSKSVAKWKDNNQEQNYLALVSTKLNIPIDQLVISCNDSPITKGVYAHPRVMIQIASWSSGNLKFRIEDSIYDQVFDKKSKRPHCIMM